MARKIKYAIVGAHSFGNSHATALTKHENVEIVATMDLHLEIAKELAEKYDIPAYYDDFDKMIANEDIEVVAVATSDKAHKEMTIRALRAGKHVVCEKPMSLFVEDCKEMIKVAEETGKLLLVGQVGRYTPAFVKAKELIDSGALGDIFFVEGEYAHDYSKIPGVDGWRSDPDRHPVIGGACHAIDLLRTLAGDPIEVAAVSNHKVLTDWPVDDCAVGIFKFPNNVIGKVFTSIGCKRNYTMRTCVYGTKGTIIFDNTSPEITMFHTNDTGLEIYGNHTTPHKIPVDVNNHNLASEHQGMIDAILEGKPLACTANEGAKTVAVCCATVQAAKEGRFVKIDYSGL